MKKAPMKMAKKSPAKNIGLKKLAEKNPNLEYKETKKSAMEMKKAGMKMVKKSAMMMKKAAGMKMKKKK